MLHPCTKEVARWTEHIQLFKNIPYSGIICGEKMAVLQNGWVHNIMVRCKAEYKSVSRRVIKNRDEIATENMAEALLNNNSRDFWNEIKKIESKGHNNPQVVDGVQNSSSLFTDEY